MHIEMGEDEIDKRVREFKDKGIDLTSLNNPNPEKRYKWVNKRPERVARYKAAGYQVTPSTDKTQASIEGKKGSGGQEFGDLVLMETSMENYKTRVAKSKYKQKMWEEGGNDQAREKINKIARDEGRVKAHKDVAFDESGNT